MHLLYEFSSSVLKNYKVKVKLHTSHRRPTRPELIPISVEWSNWGYCYSPLNGMLIYRRVTLSSMSPIPIYTPGWRETMRNKVSCNISNTRKSVSSGYPNTEKWVEKTRRSRVFLTDFEVFGSLMKHSFEFLIWLLKPFIILGEIQSRSSQNLMLIKIRYPNYRHGSDFLCFLFMNY